MKITEENVAYQLRNRNEKALYFIIDQYSGLIKSIVQKHLASFQDVQEECVDDVLLAIWNHIEKYDEEKNTLKNWIAAITKYKSIDYARKYAKTVNEKGLDQIGEIAMHTTLENEISNDMEHILNHLKKNDKEIFMKHYVQEDSVEYIAEKMGVKASFIYNRLSRGRKKLRALFLHNRMK
ncbi:sigma-70 family RNA polymerase sigma factor [Bacillus thuringiensis]|uniref:RNA polymerase subunit sigma-70 n=1 Tax=Bacillus thuringiensis subsp. finitimus TaxID=29337 RepID=A0A243GEW5_BACTF|nr:sigma-70 family RNA polymerase sigma factor [Bacillus thuringiensis]ALQ70122.1 RNA polymerase subunit sigma-70 [Bacillus thuringiensis]OUA05525.1 RNA polymerase subunit sigma-70 [Bacillus thuringiensis serovar finitimus]